jgi:hypothetical protein
MQAESSRFVTVKLKDLRPTQITVGLIAVEARVRRWGAMGRRERQAHLENRWFPAAYGPDDAYYITDHHHHGVALHRCGIKKVQVIVLKDLSVLEEKPFWMAMDHHNWVHPYNAKGHRDDFSDIPKKLTQLVDDPYRSPADHVQKLGGYAKTDLPYEDFLWADYFRHRVELGKNGSGWDNAAAAALALARDIDAKCLPGWCGAQ